MIPADPLAASEVSVDALRRAVEHARHLLPAQGPIDVFIHHNPLHAFQHLPWDEALARAHDVLDVEPYLSERAYREHLRSGRIRESDLAAALLARWERLDTPAERRRIEALALLHGMPEHDAAYVRWILGELGPSLRDDLPAEARARLCAGAAALLESGSDADALLLAAAEALHVPDVRALRALHRRDPGRVAAALLWCACRRHGFPSRPTRADATVARVGADRTLRDLLVVATGDDPAVLVDGVFVRFLAAALDQGQAHTDMPGRERGLWRAFLGLYASPWLPRPAWLRELPAHLEQLRGASAERVCLDLLREWGIDDPALPWIVERVLLELPGWAGMVAQLERRATADDARDGAPRLVEYLAVRLVLMHHAIREVAARTLGYHGTLRELREAVVASVRREAGSTGRAEDDALVGAYRLFHLAQLAGRTPQEVADASDEDVARALESLDAFDGLTRRRLLHEGYERRHRDEVLAGIAANLARPLELRSPRSPVALQVLLCIDDREEGVRRHLEELEPKVETFGIAGFFGFAIEYRGLDDGAHAALCPVVVRPRHRVAEVAHPEHVEAARARRVRRRAWTRLRRVLGTGTRSLGVGAALVPLAGVVALVALVVQLLTPRFAARLAARLARLVVPAPETRLALVRGGDQGADEAEAQATDRAAEPAPARPGADRVRVREGFEPGELAELVATQLRNVGLVRGFAPLVLVLGHGSTSANNPHRSAYDCGACGGGQGLANARAFAEAANREDVRALLRERGIDVPASTWFVGGLHDTTTDAFRLADDAGVPASHREALREAVALLARVRGRHAQERCRRFESAPRRPSPERAIAHVEARSVDLGEPRPELGHATNAVCVVGRRALTRGLFLDRRAFLVSYDRTLDAADEVLERLLAAVVPVCAGINLEYYFSCVDNARLGAGTKLPHNLVGLLGVMDGAGGDLRTGLPKQMIEIHEPVRLLMVVEAPPEAIERVCARQPLVRELLYGAWVRTVSLTVDEGTGARAMSVLEDGEFRPWEPPRLEVPVVASSFDCHRGEDGFFGPAIVQPTAGAASVDADAGDPRRSEAPVGGRRAA